MRVARPFLLCLALCSAALVAACGGSKSNAEVPVGAPAGGPAESTPTPVVDAGPIDAAPAAELPAPPPEAPKFAVKETAADQLGTTPAGLGLKVGAKAPDGSLPDVAGATVKLSKLYAKGPTFVVFYRGGWCPFCNAQLHSLTEAKPEFDKRGVQLVAISVDQPGEEAKTQAKLGVAFPMLSDSKLTVHNAYKITHKPSPEESQALAGYGVDLAAYSGQGHGHFATPAIFYVDARGVIRFAHVGADYQTRPSTAQLLELADKLATAKK